MKDYKPFIFSISFVIVLWICSIFVISNIITEPEIRGQLGDSFGVINSLFSGMAFAGIIATIFLQRNELKLQREELILTREELAKSTVAQDASQKALSGQVRIMAKQALLSSYQSFYEANLENSRNRTDPIIGIAESKKAAEVYFKLLEKMVAEIENERSLFDDSELFVKPYDGKHPTNE